jgi:hypothetical protein
MHRQGAARPNPQCKVTRLLLKAGTKVDQGDGGMERSTLTFLSQDQPTLNICFIPRSACLDRSSFSMREKRTC